MLGMFMPAVRRVKKLFRPGKTPTKPRSLRARLSFEALESRWVPAQFIVNMLGDAGAGTLRQAIIDLNTTGGADNTIVFQGAAAQGVISLNTALNNINKNVHIQGPGAGAPVLTVQRSMAVGTPNFSIFTVNANMTVRITRLTITNGNTDDGTGGGINNNGSLTIENTIITRNNGSAGGGIQNNGSLALDTGVFITHNTATIQGGGIYNRPNRSMTMDMTTVSDNVSDLNGGGIENQGTLEVNSSTISRNRADCGDGGGISNSGMLTLEASTLSRNLAGANGGGVRNSGNQNIVNSTFNRNTANRGGGLYNSGTSMQTNNTFNRNDAVNVPPGAGLGPGGSAEGGGIFVEVGALEVMINTIVAGNTINGLPQGSSPDVYGQVQSQGHNLIGDETGSVGFSQGLGDLVGTAQNPIDPMLSELGFYGGPTETQVPLAGSPAIDAGDNNGSPGPFDQRGFDRIVNEVIDIGAVEVQFSEVPKSARRRR